MGKFNSINDAIRQKIDDLVESNSLDQSKYLYTPDVVSSLNQLTRAFGGEPESTTIADALYESLDSVEAGSSGGGESGGGESGGGGSVSAKEVNFRDYDGTVVYSYTPAEFTALTAMPDNPDHSGDAIPLTAQGWNWSFEDAQAYVAKYGRLEVGQMYATADGKTHVLIHLEQGRTSPILGCCPDGTVDVDWGDGTAHDTLTGTSVTSVKWTPRHEYAAPGDYDIKLTCTGTMGFYGTNKKHNYSGLLRYKTSTDERNGIYQNAIKKVYCADNITSIVLSSFGECRGLIAIAIPTSVTDIGDSAFQNCTNLSTVTIPDSVTNLSMYTFGGCSALTTISIPTSVTDIGNNVFENCTNLSTVTIPDSVMSIGAYIFNYCTNLSTVTIPDSVTNLSMYTFGGCSALTTISIPTSVTSVGIYAFYECPSLSFINISSSITSIGNNAFDSCYGLGAIHFLSTTPPTVGSATFSSLPTDCKIYVPAGSLEAYTSAANYPSASTYTYIEEE